MWQVVLGKNRWDKISGLPDSIFSCHKLKVKAICCFVTTALASFLVFYSFLLFFHPPTHNSHSLFPKFLSGTSAISLCLGKNSKMNWSCFMSMCVCWLRHITLFFERCLIHEKCVRKYCIKNCNTFIRSNRLWAFISPRDMLTDLRDNGSKL